MKGRQLSSQVSSQTRPTTDKIRLSVFSILGDMDRFPAVLDAFAGTGALGIESYSRGASFVDFIDKDVSAVKSNANLMDKKSFNIKKGDFFKLASSLNKSYNLIFLDPPYSVYKPCDILKKIEENSLLKTGGVIVFEEFYKTEFISIDAFNIYDERRYGDTAVRFLERTI